MSLHIRKGKYRLFLFNSFLLSLSSLNAVHGEEINNMNLLDENKIIITRYFEEVWNKGKLDVLEELLSPEYINHNPGTANPKPGPDGLKPIVTAIRTGFPDLKYIIKRMVVREDQVAVLVTMTGTHKGDFFGIPATGKTINVDQMQIERIVDGKIVEHWRVTDDLSMMSQLGKGNGDK